MQVDAVVFACCRRKAKMPLMGFYVENDENYRPVPLPTPWADIPFARVDHREEYSILEGMARLAHNRTKRLTDLPKDAAVLTSSWHMFKNVDTEMLIIMRLSNRAYYIDGGMGVVGGADYFPSLMFLFSEDGGWGELTGTDLRSVPIKSICSAYAERLSGQTIINNISSVLFDYPDYKIPARFTDDVEGHALDPLPFKYSRRTWFYALVGVQYDAVAKAFPDVNATDKMVEINSSISKPTVQRWITKARKMNFLAPAKWVR